MVIWKYSLFARHELVMPTGAKILAVHAQGSDICLWAEVDPDTETKETRRFHVYATGEPLAEKPGVYLGTGFLILSGLVFHVYEETGL